MAHQTSMKLGALMNRLEEAAALLDEGKAAPTETLKCVYRDAVREAMRRLRLTVTVKQRGRPASTWTPEQREKHGMRMREWRAQRTTGALRKA